MVITYILYQSLIKVIDDVYKREVQVVDDTLKTHVGQCSKMNI